MTKAKNTKGKSVSAGSFLAGVVVAAVAGGYYLFGAKNAKQNRSKVEAWTLKAKGEVLSKIEKAKNMSQDEYEKIVDSVSGKYKKLKNVGEEKADSFSKELKKHWKNIKKEAEEMKTSVKKVTKNK